MVWLYIQKPPTRSTNNNADARKKKEITQRSIATGTRSNDVSTAGVDKRSMPQTIYQRRKSLAQRKEPSNITSHNKIKAQEIQTFYDHQSVRSNNI